MSASKPCWATRVLAFFQELSPKRVEPMPALAWKSLLVAPGSSAVTETPLSLS
jgi:hypothetical protein